MNIGEKIKLYRNLHTMTQKTLANNINKSIETIKKYENGSINPPIDVLKKIAEILNVKIEDFISNEYQGSSDVDKRIIYRLTNESDLIESILEHFGYSIEGYELSSGDYEFCLYTKEGDKLLIVPETIDNFIESLKNAIEFEIYKLIKSQKGGK